MQLKEKMMLLEAQLEQQLQSASTDSQSQSEEMTQVSLNFCILTVKVMRVVEQKHFKGFLMKSKLNKMKWIT